MNVLHIFIPLRWCKPWPQEFLQIWHQHPLGLNDELIRIWWSKVTVTSQNTFMAITQEFIRYLLPHCTQIFNRIER